MEQSLPVPSPPCRVVGELKAVSLPGLSFPGRPVWRHAVHTRSAWLLRTLTTPMGPATVQTCGRRCRPDGRAFKVSLSLHHLQGPDVSLPRWTERQRLSPTAPLSGEVVVGPLWLTHLSPSPSLPSVAPSPSSEAVGELPFVRGCLSLGGEQDSS